MIRHALLSCFVGLSGCPAFRRANVCGTLSTYQVRTQSTHAFVPSRHHQRDHDFIRFGRTTGGAPDGQPSLEGCPWG